jgi:hypothetical protein
MFGGRGRIEFESRGCRVYILESLAFIALEFTFIIALFVLDIFFFYITA